MANSLSNAPKEVQERIKELGGDKALNDRNLKKWDRCMKRGGEDGVNWKQLKIEMVTYKNVSVEGFESKEMYVYCYDGKARYKIRIDACVKTKRGWLPGDGVDWVGKVDK